MFKQQLQILAILLTFVFNTSNLFSSHLMGGVPTYRFLGETSPGSGEFLYEINFSIYLNCDATSLVDTIQAIEVNIYQNGIGNFNPLFLGLELQPIDSVPYEAQTTSDCTVGQDVCINEGIFRDTIILDGFSQSGTPVAGYHIIYNNCCRNGNIDNISDPGGAGMGFYSYIPGPALTPNSAPIFTNSVAPFLCIQDSINFSFNAFDPDGDSLVYSLFTPLEEPTSTGSNLSLPIPTVDFLPGYTETNPFGTGSQLEINSGTGISEIFIPNQGAYVFGIEVKEYRDGVYISSTFLDIQVNTVVCPPNEYPEAANNIGDTIIYEFEVIAGENICFPMIFTDADKDSLEIVINGELFDSGLTPNPAILSDTVLDSGFVSVNFCWETICENGQDLPYFYYVDVIDNGCPNKSTPIVYKVNVIPFRLNPSFPGICVGDTANLQVGYAESVTWSPDYNISSLTDFNPQVWPDSSSNYAVTGIDSNGCIDSDTVLAVVFPFQETYASNDTSLCKGDPANVSVAGGVSYVWSPSDYLDGNPTLDTYVINPDETVNYSITINDSYGCKHFDEILVEVFELPVASIEYDLIYACDSVAVNLKNESTNTVNQNWFINNDLFTAQKDFSYGIDYADSISVRLVTLNGNNCADNTSVFIKSLSREEFFDIEIPNVITPNDDGFNDSFLPIINSAFLECGTFIKIYNRWGKEIFSSEETGSLHWDGKGNNGNELEIGTYYYVLRLDEQRSQGSITLLR